MLWGVSLCLKMIQQASTLERVVIEDVSPLDRTGSSPRAFLAADITEYYGGASFENATEVVVSQLKYSHRNPTRGWTPARLAPKGKPLEKAILGKFTDEYREFRSQYGREAVLDRLKIRLISNQPCGPRLQSLVKKAQALLASEPNPTCNRTVTESLDEPARKSYDLLFRRSGLEDQEFTDFIRVLDLDYLGSGDRFEQQRRIVTTLGKHLLSDVFEADRRLRELVRNMALPEAARYPGILQADVLACLGVTGRSDLFPLPERVDIPRFVVRQPDTERLMQLIVGEAVQRIVAYGDAGVGKTISLIELRNAMPGDSVVVLYDCFGGGEYLHPTERRHDLRYAVKQLINEIAQKCGTPLLLSVSTEEQLLWRKLEQVLATAGKSLDEDGSHLVLAIDAADNAVHASRVWDEPCFVPDLWKLRLPENVHIVMTCRSARMDVLAAPDDARMIELAGFDEASSAEHLRHHFPDATGAECSEFHDNSAGNPRVQAYVLNPERVDRPPTPAGCADEAATALGDHFDDLLQTAADSRLDAGDSREWLAILMALERPIRMESLAMVLGVVEKEVSRFCHGLVPGVRIEGDTIVFRDEDFEEHVRECTRDDRIAAHGRIASCYLTLKDTHDWAAEAVAGHLFNADRAEELITLTLEDRELSAIADPLARSQTYLSRVRLALRMTPATDHSDSIKLIVLAAVAKHADSALAAIIGGNPELSMRYADPVAVARVYEAKSGEAWKGPLHMRVAASSARRGDAETARTQLALAEAWLRRRLDLDDQDRQRWRLNADDLAAGAEAFFYVAGPSTTADAVWRWHPKYALRIAERLIERLARGSGRADLALWLEERDLPIESEARLLGVLFQNGGSASPAQLQRVCRHLIEQPPSDVHARDGTWPAELIEQAASLIDDAELLDLIQALRPPLPNHAPYNGLAHWEVPLRFACLEAIVRGTDLGADDLLPTRLRASTHTDTGLTRREVRRVAEERTRLHRVLQEALPLYLLRASSASRRMQADEVVVESLRFLRPFATQPYYRNDRPYLFNQTAQAVFDSLCLTDADSEEPCKVLLSVTLGDTAPLATWLDMAGLMIRRGSHTRWALHLVDRVVRATQVRDEPLREKTERLLRCAALVDPIDETLASDYYSEVIKASSGLDEERARVLGLMNHLANSLPESHRQEGSALAPRLRQAVEHFRPFVFDSDRLPWTETLETVTRLSPEDGVRTLTLWDESGDLRLEHGVAAVAKALADRGTVDVVEAIQLLWLMDESMGCAQAALEVLEWSRKNGASRRVLAASVAWLGERITRHLTAGARLADAKALASWIEANEFGYASLATDIIAIKTMSEDLPASDEQTWEGPFRDDQEAQSARLRIADAVARASTDVPGDLEDRLVQFGDDWASSSQVLQYLRIFGSSISPSKRVPALDVVFGLQPDAPAWRMNVSAIVKALAQWTSDWSITNSVRDCAKQHLPDFFLGRFPTIVAYGDEGESRLAEYLSISAIDDPAGLVLKATSRYLRELDAEQLILVAKVLSDHLQEQRRLGDLRWILDDLLGDSDTQGASTSSAGGELLLTELAWALLGHPDKFVRCRAAHFVLDRSRASSTFCDHLMQHFDDRTGFGYYAPSSTFLWMSAQVWALHILRRLAVDAPESVSQFADRLHRIATSRGWPHALLREIARSTLLELPEETTVLSVVCHSPLALANQPAACKIKRGYPMPEDRTRDDDVRFRFNQLDTVPYWYEPLSRVFGIPTSEVETRAEGWVVDRLGYDETTVRTDRPILWRRYRYQDTYNDHGSQPRVEDFQTYLEWHAMFLVAGELADSGAPMVVRDHEPGDQWSDWLASYLDLTARLWISDYRKPVPLDRYLHAQDPPRETWREVSNADFDGELLEVEALVVSASVITSHESLYELVRVDSALVSRESAESLLVYLQDFSTPYSHPLPTEHPLPTVNRRHDLEINEPGFQLLGWLTDLDHDGSRLDEHDPLRRIRLRTVVPGREFQDAVADTYPAHEWQTSIHPLRGPVTIRRWSDAPVESRASSHPRYTEGRQTLVRIPELLTFLSTFDKDLILKVIVSRHFRRHVSLPDEQEERYDPGTARIYLLRRDGTLCDGLGRDLSAGAGDHLTTEHQ